MTAEFGTNPPGGISEYCVPCVQLPFSAFILLISLMRLHVTSYPHPYPLTLEHSGGHLPSPDSSVTDCSHALTSSERSILCASLFLPLTSLIFLSSSFFSFFDLRGLSPTTMARLSTECHHTTEITWKWAVCTRLGQKKYGGNAAVRVFVLSAVEWRHSKCFFSLDFFGPTSYFFVLVLQHKCS